MTGTGIFLINFDKIMKKVQVEEDLNKAVERIALLIEGEAKRICPVRTGRLRASIHTGKIREGVCYVGTNVHYAPYVEFGTRKMAAKPYLRPAAKRVVNLVKIKGISAFIG